MQYFGSAEKQIVPPSPHHGRQGAEVVGVLILQVVVCSAVTASRLQCWRLLAVWGGGNTGAQGTGIPIATA